ncbi:nuclear transport factor 2 family protein [Amycolatopsis suaedae]|uniref:Nuclear transport factor 2 family protein n=1 Tax=Amycolatopsis suaedae TaxID=2510978 RepID=A0A4Q7J3M1_9PSEU|nr:nuclear transport factor 2 family protein [Amycolatopsis suaedae]
MTGDPAGEVVQAEKDRIRSLLDVDPEAYDRLHAPEYELCNPTGAVWTKAQYLDLLTTGQVAYRSLELLSDPVAVAGEGVVVLRYRCAIEVTVDGTDIPRHEAWHTDVYVSGGNGWRCVWSQATGIV